MKKLLLFVLMLSLLTLPVFATETEEGTTPPDEYIEIHTIGDLQSITLDPAGNYMLMEDLDLSGIEWEAIDFQGWFDGNGHSILNLNIQKPGDANPYSCDGNRRLYASKYFGLFGAMDHAVVKNLNLVVRTDLVCHESLFVGALAGYSVGSEIENCTVTGQIELRAKRDMFGIGGFVGYGSGAFRNCTADVTLICTDMDADNRDEQFMGGLFATGFFEIMDCDVTIDGYISEHGYVHSGALCGMLMRYPLGGGRFIRIYNNTTRGKITFFEHNLNRRAYCDGFLGEVLADNFGSQDIDYSGFTRDERFEYDTELRPDMCKDPEYEENVVAPTCEEFGYTEYTCTSCGYTYRDNYTLKAHVFTNWKITQEPTMEAEGVMTAVCDYCDATEEQPVPKLEETLPEETEPEAEPEGKKSSSAVLPTVLAVAAAGIVLTAFFLPEKKK